MNNIAVYPGTFDPITLGHLDVIRRISRLYDHVYVAVAHSREKNPLFDISERVDMIKECTKDYKNVSVEDFNCLVVDYAKGRSASVMIRGIRMISDFDYEFQMAFTNRKFNPEIETVFMTPNESYSYISSRLIKEAVRFGGDISQFVPSKIEDLIKRKLGL